MSAATLPGPGDPQTWGPYIGDPSDPRDPGEACCRFCGGDALAPDDADDTPDCGVCCQQCGTVHGVGVPLPGNDRLCPRCGDTPGADERGAA